MMRQFVASLACLCFWLGSECAASGGVSGPRYEGALPPSVSLSLSGASMAEAGGKATLRALLQPATNVNVIVRLSFSGSAALTSDYTRSGTNLTIFAGSTNSLVTLTLQAVQDGLDESNETVVVSVGSVSNAMIGSPSEVVAEIVDDDPAPQVGVAVVGASWMGEAGGVVTFGVGVSAASALPVSAALSFSAGTAEPGVDFARSADAVTIAPGSLSNYVTVAAVQDSLLEGTETVAVSLGALVNGTTSAVSEARAVIADDDQHWVGEGPRVRAWVGGAPADRVRLGVRHEGVYRVTAEEFAAACGVATNEALAALAARGLSLTCRGQPVAWASDGDSLLFYGVPTDELYAPENVYWLALGAGEPMESLDASPDPADATNGWFMSELSFRSAFLAPYEPRDRRSSVATLTNVLNFGEWVPGTSVEALRAKARTLVLPDARADAPTGAAVRVQVASYRDFSTPDTHACEAWLNGVSLGSRGWSGEQSATFDYAAAPGVLTNEVVSLMIRNGLAAQVNDFMLLDASLSYPRRYRARDGALLCAGGAAGTVEVDGFGAGDIRVWDLAEERAPLELSAPSQQGTDGVWRVAFTCGGAETRYAVFEVERGCLRPSVSGARDTDWRSAAEMPAYAIIVPPARWWPGFAAAAQPLADLRTSQGLTARVVDAEDIYNAFSDGLAHPEAFVRFCAAGVTNRASPTLRYLLLAGHAGTDYKLEVFRPGELAPYPALFPLLQFSQVEASQSAALLLPNDHALGDVTGDAVPEVAVGRFLATNAAELGWAVDKTIRYELTAAWKRKAIFTADWQNVGDKYADFVGIASNTATTFALGGWEIAPFYPGPSDSYLRPYWINVNGTGAYYELAEGSGFFYYVGHSSDTIAGSSTPNKLFDSDTFKQADWPFAPVGFLMGCRMGRWTLLDLREQQQCIAEAGVRCRSSGFAAAVASAGYSTTGDAAAFSYACASAVASGAQRLGDVIRGALGVLGGSFSARSRHIAVLGDPALSVNPNVTALGTPTAWLVAHGLTGDPYAEWADVDGDAFDARREYLAGTSPTQALVRIRGFGARAAGGSARALTFETIGGRGHRVTTATNLASGAWESLPWRPGATSAWSWAAIPVDWPVETVEVPVEPGGARRFFRVQADE